MAWMQIGHSYVIYRFYFRFHCFFILRMLQVSLLVCADCHILT